MTKYLVATYDEPRCELGMGIYDNLDNFPVGKMGNPIWWQKCKALPDKQTLETMQFLMIASIRGSQHGDHQGRVNKALWHLNKWRDDGFRVLRGSLDDAVKQML